MRLLFAEDEKSLSRAITAILKKNHYEVDAVYDGFPQVTSAETVVGHRGHGLVGKERDALSFVSGYPCLHAVESVFQSRGFLAQRDAACPATGIRVEHVTAIGIHHVVV